MIILDKELSEIDAVFLDLDGTIYLGGELIPGALDFLKRCDESGIKRFFLSNNSSRSVKQYLLKLNDLGIPATPDDVLLSTHDLLSWLDSNDVTETWLVGTEGMKEMLEEAGISTDSETPQFVVLEGGCAIGDTGSARACIRRRSGRWSPPLAAPP